MDKQYLITDNFEIKQYNLYMTFHLEDKIYAAPAKSISEVVKLPMLNVPESLPEHIVGIINLRGNIINILDVRNLLGLPAKEYALEDCILVLRHNDLNWGVIVDSVNNVKTICNDQISTTPYGARENRNLISSMAKTDEGLMGILNLEFLTNILAASLDHQESMDVNVYRKSYQTPPSFSKNTKALEIFHKRATELQKELSLSLEKDQGTHQRFVTFLLNNEMYAISLKFIREFSKIINLAIVPCVPEFYVGLSNLRGEFIPVVDIKGFLGISKTYITDKSKIIFVRTPRMQLGIIVDEVFDIIKVSDDKVNKSPVMKIDKGKYTSGEIILDNHHVINIFDLDKFMQDERLIIEEAV